MNDPRLKINRKEECLDMKRIPYSLVMASLNSSHYPIYVSNDLPVRHSKSHAGLTHRIDQLCMQANINDVEMVSESRIEEFRHVNLTDSEPTESDINLGFPLQLDLSLPFTSIRNLTLHLTLHNIRHAHVQLVTNIFSKCVCNCTRQFYNCT